MSGATVVGEDLGTVPAGFRERMAEANVLSYRVLYFEKDGDRFKQPEEYPGLALACVTTHDLATLSGFWSEADINLKRAEDLFAATVEREKHKSEILEKTFREALQKAQKEPNVRPRGPLDDD